MAIKRLDGVNRTIATCFVRRVSHSFRHGLCNIVCKADIATPVKVFPESNFEGTLVFSRLPEPTQMMKRTGNVQRQVFENQRRKHFNEFFFERKVYKKGEFPIHMVSAQLDRTSVPVPYLFSSLSMMSQD